MSVPSDSDFGIRFVEQAEFDRMLRERTLTPGFWYFVGNSFRIAFSRDTYGTYGGASVQDIVNELLQRENFTTELIEGITANETFINVVAQTIIADTTFRETIAVLLLSDLDFRNAILQAIANILTKEFIVDILSDVISIIAPDGSSVATNDGGRLTLQVATNEKFGIVKGQSNTSPTTWHNVSAANGMLSINREQVEVVMDGKDTAIKNAINVRAEDNCIVGTNSNGIITLPIRQAESATTPPQGLTLIKE